MLAGWQPRFGASPHPFLQWSGNLSTISQASQTPVTLGKVPPPPSWDTGYSEIQWPPRWMDGCSFLVPGSSALPLVWWLPTAPTQSICCPCPTGPMDIAPWPQELRSSSLLGVCQASSHSRYPTPFLSAPGQC